MRKTIYEEKEFCNSLNSNFLTDNKTAFSKKSYHGTNIKVGLSPSKEIFFICVNHSPSKIMKKCFLFHLSSSFPS